MNKSERKGFDYLVSQGIPPDQIVYQGRRTPDFITPKGRYEIKRAYNRTITFSWKQKDAVLDSKAQVLVFADGKKEPVLVLYPRDIKGQTMKGYLIKIKGEGVLHDHIIKVTDPVHRQLEGIKTSLQKRHDRRMSHSEVIERILQVFLKTETR